MEVTPEIYAWLSSLNIIDPLKSLSEDIMNIFIIPEKTLNLLFGGKYMDVILKNLQDSYNKFYKVKMNYINNITQLKPIQEDQEYISNSIKFANWQIIVGILNHFGLSYSEEEINLLVNNDKAQLNKIISKIYDLYTQFLKHSVDNDAINTSYANTNSNKGTKKYIISTSNNKNSEQTKESKIETTDNNINKKSINTINSLSKNIEGRTKMREDSLNINELDPYKSYKDCKSVLEYFIVSICKSFQMKPRQAVAVLSNNRKYLSIICHKGFNNNFIVLKNWLSDIYNNKDILLKIVQESEDGSGICYQIIGTAISCHEPDISLQSAQLLNIIKYKIGMNWDWFLNEGINSFIFILTKQDKNKLELLKILYDFIKEDTDIFFSEIKKIYEKEKKKIFQFLSNIISVAVHLNSNFSLEIQNLIFDICLKEKNDLSYAISMLSDSFFYFYPIHEDFINKILLYFRECIKSNVQNVFSTAVSHTFILLERFGKVKNKYAPQLYKNLVFLFLEEYDNEYKREIILEGFENFFNSDHEIPIDILLEPYLSQLNTCNNYSLCDFFFLLKMVEHPRIESKDINDIIQFILSVCLNNIIFSRTANIILTLIFEKKTIEKTCTNPYDINEVEFKLVDFINTALDSYITNLSKEEDKFILETPYDIMAENFTNVNMQVKETIIKSIKVYRKLKGGYSNSLLAMLWYYSDNDDIMCQIEELNRPIYEPMNVYYERKRIEQEERDKKDFTKKLINNLNKMQEKKENMIRSRQVLSEQKKLREERIKQRLAERRRIQRVLSGMDAPTKAPILFYSKKLKRSASDVFNPNKFKLLPFNPNNIETGKMNSNMQYAINIAAKNYMNKGIIQENSKLISNALDSNQKIRLRKNNSQANLLENKDEIFKKYGNIMSIDKAKMYNDAEKEYKLYQKMEMSKLLIQKEGKYVNSSQNSSRGLLTNKITTIFLGNGYIDKVMGLPFNLDDEENRELKAIKGYNKEYKKNLLFYFKSYSNQVKKTITKSKFMKMLRDKGINSERMDYEEVNLIIRRLFKENISEFNFNQFVNLLVQVSYLIYTKRRPTLTIGETYGILLKRFSLNNNAEKIALLKKKYEAVIDYLLELKEDNEPFNLPEGFKFVRKTSVKYNSRLAPHFMDYLGEGNFICYQVLEDILFHIFNSSIIEPYVEVSTEETVEIEPEKLHNWTPDLTMAYIDLDKKYKFHGMFAADAIEDGLRKILKKYKNEEDIKEENSEVKKHKVNMSWARKDIKLKMELYKKIIIDEKNKKKQKRINLFKLSREEKAKVEEKFEEVKKRREKKEEEKKNKILVEQEKKKEKEEKKIKAWNDFNKGQKRKLKQQFKEYKTKKREQLKKEEDKKEDEMKVSKQTKEISLSKKNEEYFAFEKHLNDKMKELSAKEEIKKIFEEYNNHLKLIYDIYSRISYNKISFYSKEVIRINEFKEFLINFTVLGVLISAELMIWIFNNIAKASQDSRNNQMYLNFDDFKLSLCYLSIFSKIRNSQIKRKEKIFEDLKNNIAEVNGEDIEKFMKILGLKIPYNRLEIEKFINERRSISMKSLLNIQNHLKKGNREENKRNMQYKKYINKKEDNKTKSNNQLDNNNADSNINKSNEEKGQENNFENEKTIDDNSQKKNANINNNTEKENKINTKTNSNDKKKEKINANDNSKTKKDKINKEDDINKSPEKEKSIDQSKKSNNSKKESLKESSSNNQVKNNNLKNSEKEKEQKNENEEEAEEDEEYEEEEDD